MWEFDRSGQACGAIDAHSRRHIRDGIMTPLTPIPCAKADPPLGGSRPHTRCVSDDTSCRNLSSLPATG
jgi:hypothetical protein